MATKRGIQYIPAIDGLRALAVIAVMFYHLGFSWIPGGFLGVDLFFVISGFVITSALVSRLRTRGSIEAGHFYLARIRRLLPALAVMLTVVLLASMLFGAIGALGITARTGGAAALINANTYLWLFDVGGYFDTTSDLNPLLHTWSLSVEEQFYLVWPLLVLVVAVLIVSRAALPPPPGTSLLRFDHPLAYPPFQYEGHTPRERTVLRATDLSIRLIRLAAPATVPDHPPPDLLYRNADRPTGR